jgi:GNAT superfamily N-acetyltransferase/predicted nucleic acid-binding protein
MKILSDCDQVIPYVDKIREAADRERDSFGFLPSSAYDNFVQQGRILIAVEKNTGSLIGYTVFGGAMPQGRIFQTWTSPDARGRGVGRKLISEVIERLENLQFLSVRADVADDLESANEFYNDLGFEVVRTKPGGKSRGRTINVRVRELATPSLLEMAGDRSIDLGRLSIGVPAVTRAALYVIDLNVIFDITKQRVRSEAASRVMSAAFENDIRLSISAELLEELERHTPPDRPDPILNFSRTLPRLPLPPRNIIQQYTAELAPIIFPNRATIGKLKIQDYSDLKHLITAIHECATGFITSENAILRAAPYLRKHHGLDVLPPETFTSDSNFHVEINVTSQDGSSRIASRPMNSNDYDDAAEFLSRHHVTPAIARTILSSGTSTLPRRRYIIRVDQNVCAIGTWEPPSLGSNPREIYIYLDEQNAFTTTCAEHLIGRAISDTGAANITAFNIRPLTGQPTVRRVAISNGFFPVGGLSPRSQNLRKIAIGHPLTPENWKSHRSSINKLIGLRIPATPPNYKNPEQPIEVLDRNGKSMTVSISDLENLVSPSLIILPHRPSIIAPITGGYAEELFRGSSQPSFLYDREAVLHHVRGYISGPASYSKVREGSILIFYESSTGGGRSAATAVARVTRRYLMEKDAATEYASTRAVLDERAIQGIGRTKNVTVSEFDNLMLFQKPVPLKELRSIGCADGANFVTARSISTEHLSAILRAGEPHA